jgi:secreted trypsin-like serine protease
VTGQLEKCLNQVKTTSQFTNFLLRNFRMTCVLVFLYSSPLINCQSLQREHLLFNLLFLSTPLISTNKFIWLQQSVCYFNFLLMDSMNKYFILCILFNLFYCCFTSYAIASEGGTSGSMLLPITPKIVGGATALPGSWPWMVALIRSDSLGNYYGQFCGGTLVAESWVITAAHCVDDKVPSEVDVVTGVYNLKTEIGDRISVKQIIEHPSYNPLTFDNDLALIELNRSSSSQTIPLSSDVTNDLLGSMATVVGWGYTGQIGSSGYPEELQQVSIPIVSNTDCGVSYPSMITSNMLCAGYVEGGKDSCVGDSGGPLMVQKNGEWEMSGIVSWGDDCGAPNSYGVYTRVSQFVDFISSKIIPQPTITVTPLTIQFGYVPLGMSREYSIVIENNGDANLVIGDIGRENNLKPPFALTEGTCSSATLSPAQQCYLSITYTPEILQNYKVRFDIPSNDPVSDPYTVHITARKHFPWYLFVPAIINRLDQP